jgi:hypothetical protein
LEYKEITWIHIIIAKENISQSAREMIFGVQNTNCKGRWSTWTLTMAATFVSTELSIITWPITAKV